MKRVLYDTDVLLDVLLRREPHFAGSAAALDGVGRDEVEGYIAAHAVTTIAYIMEKRLGRTKGRRLLTHLLSRLIVAPVTDAAIRNALAIRFKDLEDALCHAAAQEAGVTLIVTRNTADFSGGTIPAVHPEVFSP